MQSVQEMIKDLLDVGYTQTSLAEAVDFDQSTISRVVRGKQKTFAYDLGKAIEMLHKTEIEQQPQV